MTVGRVAFRLGMLTAVILAGWRPLLVAGLGLTGDVARLPTDSGALVTSSPFSSSSSPSSSEEEEEEDAEEAASGLRTLTSGGFFGAANGDSPKGSWSGVQVEGRSHDCGQVLALCVEERHMAHRVGLGPSLERWPTSSQLKHTEQWQEQA